MNVLFLCTGNSARSILAECLLNRYGEGKFTAFSAGSNPVGKVNPHAVSLLRSKGYTTDGLRSKSWDEFSDVGAPQMDLVVTVCGNAAGEVCPRWPGAPLTVHWGFPDPAAASHAAAEAAFTDTYSAIKEQIMALCALSLDGQVRSSVHQKIREISPKD